MTMKMKRVFGLLLTMVLVLSSLPGMGQAAHATDGDPVSGGAPEIAAWAGWRKGAASFTFEQGAPSHVTDAGPLIEKYGYRASFYLVLNWNPDWNGFQALADKGHEIGSNSNTYPQNMSGEEASSKRSINAKITQRYGCITLAYPNGNVPNRTAVLQNYIAGRMYHDGTSITLMGKDGPSDWARVPSVMTGSVGVNTGEGFISYMEQAVAENGWITFAARGFLGKNNGNAYYSPTDLDALEDALIWARENDEDIWIAPLRDVAMYIKERNASELTLKTTESGSVTYTLTHSIADNICAYDYPLTVRVPMPDGWNAFALRVTQNEIDLACQVKDGMVSFDAVPNGGDIILMRKNVLTLPASVTAVKESAFEGAGMTAVYVSDACAEIGAGAFRDCISLKKVRLPKDCDIDDTAFAGCMDLTAICAPAGGTTETWCLNNSIPFAAEDPET